MGALSLLFGILILFAPSIGALAIVLWIGASPASRTPTSHRASSVNETAIILRAVRPGLWFKVLPILGLYPGWNSGSSVPYNGLLERPLSIVPLRKDSVMCQSSTCPNPAAFVVHNTTGSMKALCREHLISLGVAESELPHPEGR
jgi:hypothetical protein